MQSPQCSSRTGHVGTRRSSWCRGWSSAHPFQVTCPPTLGRATDSPLPRRPGPPTGPPPRACAGLSVRPPAYGQGHDDGPGHVRRPGHAPVVRDLRRRRPRDHRRQPGRVRHHRDRRGQGARRRGARRVPDPGQPGRPHPGVHLGAHRHHRRDGRRCPAHRGGPARRSSSSPRGSVLVAHNAGFDISFLKAARARTEHEWPGFAVLDTVHLARQLVHRDEVPNHRLASLAVLFRATTTPDHRALHDARATVDVLHGLIERVGGRSGSTPRGAARLHRPGHPGPAPQAPPRRRPAPCAGRLPVQGRAGPGPLRRHLGLIRTRVRSLLHRLRAPPPDGRDGAHRREVSPIVCATTARGRGPRAAPHRRAQAALQPALARRPSAASGSSSPSRPSPGCRMVRGAPTTAPVCRAVRLAARPPRRRWPRSTRCSRCASACSGSPPPGR